MAKLWAIIKREYLERVRSKWFLIATFFGPLFFGAIIIIPTYIASKSTASTEIYGTVIIDVTGTDFGKRVADAIKQGVNGGRASPRQPLPGPAPVVRSVQPSQLASAESTATHETMTGIRPGYLVVHKRTSEGESG